MVIMRDFDTAKLIALKFSTSQFRPSLPRQQMGTLYRHSCLAHPTVAANLQSQYLEPMKNCVSLAATAGQYSRIQVIVMRTSESATARPARMDIYYHSIERCLLFLHEPVT